MVLNDSGDSGLCSRAVVSREDGESLWYPFVFWVNEEKPDHPTRVVYYRKAVG